MSEEKLALAKREVSGKKVKSLREQGLIPSVVFGGKEPIMTQSVYNETEKAVRIAGYHSPIDLTIDGKKQMALVKNVAMDPVKRTILNIEFQAISANEVVEATTPIKIVGFESSDANKAHLVLSQVLEEIDVKAKPADLPEAIEIENSPIRNSTKSFQSLTFTTQLLKLLSAKLRPKLTRPLTKQRLLKKLLPLKLLLKKKKLNNLANKKTPLSAGSFFISLGSFCG